MGKPKPAARAAAKAEKAEKRGKKRARDEEAGDANPEEKENTRRTRRKLNDKPPVDPVQKAENRLRGAQSAVLKAAKAAKLFETQRLVKKLKNARIKQKDEELAKQLEGELETVKEADPHDVCNEALSNRIRKDGQLSHDEHCLTALDIVIPRNKQVKTVRADQKRGWHRLISSKKLARGIHHVMLSLKKEFASTAKREEMKKRMEEEKEQRHKEGKFSRKERIAMGLPRKAPEDEKAEGEGGEDDVDSDEEDDDEDVDAMLEAGKGEEDDDEEDDDDDDDSEDEAGDKKMKDAKDEDVDLPDGGSDAPVDDFEDSDGEGDGAEGSTFLPSLKTGFVAGSDSELDDDGKDVDGTERKNRRGQRARKAIWEKKYGKNANHIKKAREEAVAAGFPEQPRNQRGGFDRGRGGGRGGRGSRGRGGYQVRPGGFDPRNAKKTARGRGMPVDSGWAGRRERGGHSSAGGAESAHSAPAHAPVAEKPMHPSWEAKKNEKLTGQAVGGQGKKIVFVE